MTDNVQTKNREQEATMTISRRRFLKTAAAVPVLAGAAYLNPWAVRGARAALSPDEIKSALAKHRGRSLTISSWGGSFQEAQRKAFFKPFSDAFGIEIVEDGPPTNPKIVAMVQANNVTWDVCDIGAYKPTPLGKDGYLEELDYSIIDKTDVFPGFATKWGIGNLSYSTVLAYRTDVLSDPQPQKVADLWDLKRFPGQRALRDNPIENLAFALEADGVPLKDIYPLDEEKIQRAFAKLDELRDNVIWWSQGAQAPQLIANKEVVMATAWNGRLDKLRDEGIPIGVVWDGAQLMGDAWVIPKGAPNVDVAMLFIAWSTTPEINWRLSEFITYGPVNYKAIKYVRPERAAMIPTSFADVQVPADYDYWGDAYNGMVDRWKEWRLG
jgi:putative spermidine/putrescine transport system substrate-binding protein